MNKIKQKKQEDDGVRTHIRSTNHSRVDLAEIAFVLLIIFMVISIFTVIIAIIVEYDKVILNQDTANEICINLTNQEQAQASSEDGKLICEIPGFGEPKNIIIKGKNDK